MFEKGRTKKLALLGIAAIALAVAGVAPVFAWTITPGSPFTCVGTAWSTTCATNPSYAIGTTVYDTVKAQLSNDGGSGTITWKVYALTGVGACTTTGSALFTTTASIAGDGSYHTIPTPTGFSTTGHSAGSYAWTVTVTYSDATPKSACEPFTLFTAPPPPTVPQFPLGMALLLALAIPALLLIRSKFASKPSFPSLKV